MILFIITITSSIITTMLWASRALPVPSAGLSVPWFHQGWTERSWALPKAMEAVMQL